MNTFVFLWIPSRPCLLHLKEDNLSLEEIYRVIQPNQHFQAGWFLALDQTSVFHGLLEPLERLSHLRLFLVRKCLLQSNFNPSCFTGIFLVLVLLPLAQPPGSALGIPPKVQIPPTPRHRLSLRCTFSQTFDFLGEQAEDMHPPNHPR